MGFPIAIGAKSVSSRAVSPAEPLEEFAADGVTTLFPALVTEDGTTLLTATTEDLQAVITLSYYDMIREDSLAGAVEYCTAELRVQISPAAEPFCSDESAYGRETVHRIPLPGTGTATTETSTLHHQRQKEVLTAQPQAVLSADQRFLTCLIPHPSSCGDSSVVVFQLRRPRGGSTQSSNNSNIKNRPPLPPYIQRPVVNDGDNDNSMALVATNPRVLQRPRSLEPLLDVTCICDVGTTTTTTTTATIGSSPPPSVLLVACRDGSLRTASYRPLVLGEQSLYEFDDDEAEEDGAVVVVAMEHLTEWNDPRDGAVGRLVVVLNDGNVSVFRSHLDLHRCSENGDGSHAVEDSLRHSLRQNGSDRPLLSNGYSSTSISSAQQQPTVLDKGAVAIRLTETHRIPEVLEDGENDESTCFFVGAAWVAGSYLALAQIPSTVSSSVQVYGLYDQGRSAPVSTLCMTWNRLRETAHTTIRFDPVPPAFLQHRSDVRIPTPQNGRNRQQHAPLSLVYDPVSDSIAFSSFLLSSGNVNNSSSTASDSPPIFHQSSFVCLWSWRSNAQGFTAMASEVPGRYDSSSLSPSSCFSLPYFAVSKLFFTKHHRENRRGIAHLMASVVVGDNNNNNNNINNSFGPRRWRKEMYDTALLSPPHHENWRRRATLDQPCTLLLSPSSVSYPIATKASTGEDSELQWSESFIPPNYMAAHGAPQLAAIGRTYNRSIALAAARGLCILDCSSGADKANEQGSRTSVVSNNYGSGSSNEQRDADFAKFLRRGHSHPRWYLFGSEADERLFRVVSMVWWEAPDPNSMSSIMSDDVLVAVIEVLGEREEKGFYLSCWPCSSIDSKSQLLCPSGARHFRAAKEFKWGTRLPTDFNPASLDLLCLPCTESACSMRDNSLERKSCALLADASYAASYLVYQLQIVPSVEIGLRESKPYEVLSRYGSSGTIGSPAASLFLAGASFAYSLIADLENGTDSESASSSYVATIGVMRLYGAGLDAISVCPAGVVAVGEVVNSADTGFDDPLHAELSSFWMADIVSNVETADNSSQLDLFVWVLQLASGRLLSWSAPYVLTVENLHYMTGPTPTFPLGGRDIDSRTVHPKGILLGTVCEAGTTSRWMQRSAQGARTDFLAGSVPRSTFGCVIGVTQSCRKLHRSLGEEFESELFRPDFLDHEIMCPGDFTLYPPVCLASLYSLVHESAIAWVRTGQKFDYFNQHVRLRMGSVRLQNMTVMSLELLIMRSVEKIATLRSNAEKDSAKLAILKGMLASLVATVRETTTPLQFTMLFLKIGRQIEPSCLRHLFPLPSSTADPTSGGETMDDLFDGSLSDGSVAMSVSALPLLTDAKTTTSMCAASFHHCLNDMDARFDLSPSGTFHDQGHEGRDAAAAVFRYALKLLDPECDDEQSGTDDEDDRDLPRSFSIMCGITRMFSRKPVQNSNESSPFLVNGVSDAKVEKMQSNGSRNIRRLLSWQCCSEESFKTVAAVAARYILVSLFDANAFAERACWKRLGALAVLLMGDDRTGYRFCSQLRFDDLLHATKPGKFIALLPLNLRRNGGLVKFFKNSICSCSRDIDSTCSSHVFDLVLLLLGTESNDFEGDIPGLLLAAIVAGHASGRIPEIMMSGTSDSTVWASYLEAHTELSLRMMNGH